MLPDLISASGNTSWWLPIAATAVTCFAIVGTVGTLAYRRLRLQKLCLDTAVDNMCQGLTMFDRSDRLVAGAVQQPLSRDVRAVAGRHQTRLHRE
jgi:hypothetical protein